MALDTLAKRVSALNVSDRVQLPIPDGTIDQGDRQSVLMVYAGILAGVAAEVIKNAHERIAITIGLGI